MMRHFISRLWRKGNRRVFRAPKPLPYTTLLDIEPAFSHLTEKAANYVYHLHLRPVGVRTLPLGQLKHHYRHELNFDHYLRDKQGRVDRSILKHPFFFTSLIYLEKGRDYLLKNLKDIPYYRLLSYEGTIGWKYNRFNLPQKIYLDRSEKQIRAKIEQYLDLIDHLQKVDYLDSDYEKHYVTVLQVPFEESRYGRQLHQTPWEIFGGNHRAAALAALGKAELKVLELRDVYDGEKIAPEMME